MTTEERVQELKAQVTIMESPLQVKEIVEDFVLLTYDIPVTEEGNKARLEFYKQARHIGAIQHTESVFYMPWSHRADAVVLNLADKGKVFVWYTKAHGGKAEELTARYDLAVRNWMDGLEERLERTRSHIRGGRLKLAERMMEKTISAYGDLKEAVENRGSASLKADLEKTKAMLAEVSVELIRKMR